MEATPRNHRDPESGREASDAGSLPSTCSRWRFLELRSRARHRCWSQRASCRRRSGHHAPGVPSPLRRISRTNPSEVRSGEGKRELPDLRNTR